MRYLIALLVALPLMLQAQNDAVFDFNNCLSAPAGFSISADAGTGCICGYEGDGVLFNGISDSIAISGIDSGFIDTDFTLSFLMSPDLSNDNIQTVVSQGDSCFADNTFSIRYDGMNETVAVELFESISQAVLLSGPLLTDLCWHEIVLRREGNLFQLIIDGVLADELFFDGGLEISSTAPIQIGSGACVGTVTDRYDGVIDNFQIVRAALPRFTFRLPTPPESILTPDTVIFQGEIIDAISSVNCATSVLWSPAGSVSNVNDFNPILTPDSTTQYIARYTADRCSFTDTLNVVVLRDGDIACDDLRLPSAFTPNGDGLNETYGISNVFITEGVGLFNIFSRNGALVFSATDLSAQWDGRWRTDGKLRPGTYLYKVSYTCRGEAFSKTGSLSILR